MFDKSLLNKLGDAIPANVKEKVKETVKEKLSGNAADLKSSTMERLGFAKPAVSKTSSPEAVEASAASGDDTAVDQPEAEGEDEDKANT
jgi:hypothetical protein